MDYIIEHIICTHVIGQIHKAIFNADMQTAYCCPTAIAMHVTV